MIEWSDRINDLIEHPAISIIVGSSVAAAGAMNKWAQDLPLVHEVLSDTAIAVGILTALVGLFIQISKLPAAWRKFRRDLKNESDTA
jgi:uncharacterized protein YjeT (DUF2065 family)